MAANVLKSTVRQALHMHAEKVFIPKSLELFRTNRGGFVTWINQVTAEKAGRTYHTIIANEEEFPDDCFDILNSTGLSTKSVQVLLEEKYRRAASVNTISQQQLKALDVRMDNTEKRIPNVEQRTNTQNAVASKIAQDLKSLNASLAKAKQESEEVRVQTNDVVENTHQKDGELLRIKEENIELDWKVTKKKLQQASVYTVCGLVVLGVVGVACYLLKKK